MFERLEKLPIKNRVLLVLTLLLAALVPITVYSTFQRVSTAPRAATNTLNLQVSSGSDDAYQSQSAGVVNTSGLYIFMTSYSVSSVRYSGGFRFTNVTVPKGSTITSAVFQPYVYSAAYDNPNVNIFANNVDNAKDFVTEKDVVGRARTSNYVAWVATNLGAGYKSSPDIKNVIQEVINRSGWSPGNAIAILVDGKTDLTRQFYARSYEYPVAGSSSAKLTISYTLPVPTADIKANNSDGPITIAYNSPATISWGSSYTTSCSVSPTGWSGTANLGISTGNLTGSKTYTLSCSGAGGSALDSVTVNVSPPPSNAVTADIKANGSNGPVYINSGSSVTISWSSNNATSCKVSPDGWTGTSGSKSSGSLTSAKTYTLNCSGAAGSASDSVKVSIGTPPKPEGKTLESLQLEVSMPYLVGKTKINVAVGGSSKEIQTEGKFPETYSLDLKDANLALNQPYNLVLTSEKALVRKISFDPASAETKVAVGDLILGDINQDNSIDWLDQLALVSSIASRSLLGDLDANGVTNSFDWAILFSNFGKKGD